MAAAIVSGRVRCPVGEEAAGRADHLLDARLAVFFLVLLGDLGRFLGEDGAVELGAAIVAVNALGLVLVVALFAGKHGGGGHGCYSFFFDFLGSAAGLDGAAAGLESDFDSAGLEEAAGAAESLLSLFAAALYPSLR